eukprot:c15580_g1_i1.p1 GENE.c15580_g1_i1~~c15580_g1_i1.p1  ORF type:complete len:330 (+),score=62.86 c15580_g1_i1:42-1031(+)
MALGGCVPLSGVEAVWACLIYLVCSNCMVLSNKAILSYYEFNFPLSLMLFQAVCTTLIIELGRLTGKIECEPINLKTAKQILPLNLMFVAMICTAGFATEYLSVPFLTIFKNLTNVAITFGEQRLFGQSVSRGVLLSIFVMVAGSCCAAVNDIQFNAQGYLWMLCNCAVTASYILYMKLAMDTTKLSKDGMALYNNTIGIPIIFVLVCLQERDVVNYPSFDNKAFIAVTVMSGIVGFAMSLATFYTISKTSPTTYSMAGALNKIPASIIGAFLFKASISVGGWVGICIGLLGGIIFAYVKATEEGAKNYATVHRDEEGEKEGLGLISKT